MENIEKNIDISSNKLNNNDYVKVFVYDDNEIDDVLKFEKKLINLLNSLRTEQTIKKDIEIANEELLKKHLLFEKKKKKYYKEVIEKCKEELYEIEILRNIITSQVIDDNNSFKYLMYYINEYSNKDIIKVYIKSSKSLNVSTSFLNCFDEKGVVKEESILLLEKIISKMYKSNELTKFKNIKFEKLTNMFFTEEQKNYIKSKLQEEKESELKEKQEKLSKIAFKSKEEIEEKKYSIFVDSFGNLKKMSLMHDINTVLNDIQKVQNSSKTELEKYKKQYEILYTQQEIKNLLQKANIKEKNTLLSIIENKESLESASKIILDSNFMKLDISDKKSILLEEFINDEDLEISENQTSNLFVFPTEDFIKNELETITKKVNLTKDTIKKSIKNKFEALEKNNIQEMKTKYKDVIHRIHDSKSKTKTLTICNNLIGYRFGHKVNKIGYSVLPMPESNKKLLSEKYNFNGDFQVLIILGFGNVLVENENDMYDRFVQTSRNNEKYYYQIIDIFSKPFTKESFIKACEYVESGNLALNNELDFNYLNTEKTQNKKAV